MILLVSIINSIVTILTLLVFISSLLSFFMAPYHPVRETIDRIVDPMLTPIRRVVPPMGGLDFSPWILIILIQIIGRFLTGVLLRL